MRLPPDTVLRTLIDRLKPKVGDVPINILRGFWGEASADEADARRAGRGHLVEALRRAQAALDGYERAGELMKAARARLAGTEQSDLSGRDEGVLRAEALAARAWAKVEDAASLCQALERQGDKMALSHAATRRRSSGGKSRGGKLHQAAEPVWDPWIREFQALIRDGKDAAAARRTISSRMARKGFVLPNTGKPPERKSLEKWLK